MEIKTTEEISVMDYTKVANKSWVAVNDHLKVIQEIGRLCVGKLSRYDFEQIEKIRKLCLEQINLLNPDNAHNDESVKK